MSIITKGYGVGSSIITQGYGILTTIYYAVVRKIFKREKYIVFQRDTIDAFAYREPVEVLYYREVDTFAQREAMDTFYYARKQDKR